MGYCEPMKNFFRNNYGFILGFITGIGFFIFCIEASKPIKNPLVYLGGWGLSLVASAVYRKLKRDTAAQSAKENNETKVNKISAA